MIDLWRSLSKNHRGHPLLTALLYSYCPAAARWWLAGAEPVINYDVVYHALTDIAAGKRLKDSLVEYGFQDFLIDARRHIDHIKVYRGTHRNIASPELLPLFRTVELEKLKFGYRDSLQAAFGGKAENILSYIRVYSHLLNDWAKAMRFESEDVVVERTDFVVTLQGWSAARFEGWVLSASHKYTDRRALVWQVDDVTNQNALMVECLMLAQSAGAKPWNTPPEVWFLTYDGQVAGPEKRLSLPLKAVSENLTSAAKSEICPPINAIHAPVRCAQCAFKAQCWTRDAEISPLALSYGGSQ